MKALEPKEIEIKISSGELKTFIISKFPAIAGREIVSKYPIANTPKLGEYAVSEETMLKLMAYVAVPTDGEPQFLSNKTLVNNHVESWEILTKLEWAMLEYNCSFFRDGGLSNFFENFAEKLPAWISKISPLISGLSSGKNKQP